MKRRHFLGGISATAALSWFSSRVAVAAAKPALPRRRLGRTNEQVSIIGLGGYHIGIQRDPKESIRIIRTAIDAGINFLDNCWDYNAGESELRMGKALRDGYRARAFLMTKIDGQTYAAATRQLDESLRRLQTDHVDLLQFHEVIRPEDPERIFGKDAAFKAVMEAKRAGKVRFVGFTGHKSAAIHRKMIETGLAHGFTFDTVQMPLNVMDGNLEGFEKQVLPLLIQHDIGVLGMKPLGSGIILKSGAVTAPECLRYALSLPTSVVITGCDSLRILEQALRAGRGFAPLSGAERADLLSKAAAPARAGEYELYKTSHQFDGTSANPEWLG